MDFKDKSNKTIVLHSVRAYCTRMSMVIQSDPNFVENLRRNVEVA